MKSILSFLFFVAVTLFSTGFINRHNEFPTVRASMDVDSSMIVNNCVMAITGDYFEDHRDLVVPGPEPLIVPRVHLSSDRKDNGVRGQWRDFVDFITVDDSNRPIKVYLHLSSGGVLNFESVGKHTGFHHTDDHQWDLRLTGLDRMTNTGHGELSARTHPKNISMKYYHGPCRFIMTNGAGEQKTFALKKVNGQYRAFELIKETHANGNWLSYERSDHNILKLIQAHNRHGAGLSHVKFHYGEKYVQALGSHHLAAHYHFKEAKIKKYIRHPRAKRGTTTYREDVLYQVIFPNTCAEQYDYEDGDEAHTKFGINRRFTNHGRFLKTYYEHHTHKVITQLAPVGEHGAEVTLANYKYEDEYTGVTDANGHLTRYHFYKNHRPRSVLKFLNGKEYCQEISLWGSGNFEGNLIAKFLYVEPTPGDKRFFSYRSFEYDASGNVLKEHLWGSLTGRSTLPLKLDAQENPIDKDAECYTKSYAYDHSHLMLSESDGRLTTRYTYQPGTNLVTSKLIYDGDHLCERHFFKYNENATLIEQMSDNGTALDPNDLTGTSQRQIYRCTTRSQEPGFGFPEIEQQLYYDFETAQEKLLKQTINTYSQYQQLIRQDIYDADLQFRYSLNTEYDGGSRPVLKTDPLGQKIHYQYDGDNNIVYTQGPNPNTQTHYTFDHANRLVKTEKKDSQNSTIEQQRYDRMSRRIATIDECGNETNFEYDPLGRLTKTIHPPIKGQRAYTTQQYDPADNIVSETDERGYTTTRTYNTRKQPTAVHYPDGTFETFEYALNGFLTKSRTRIGTVTVYERDYLGNPTTESVYSSTGELLTTTQKEYVLGQIIREVDAEGQVTSYQYDGAGRLTAMRKGDSLATHTYDNLGRQIQVREYQDAQTYVLKTYDYDLLDRMIEETVQDTEGNLSTLQRYAYNPDGKRTHVYTYDAADTSYVQTTEYDHIGRPIQHIDQLGHVTRIDYTWNRVLVKTTTDPLGNRTIETYDTRKRLETLEKQNAAGMTLHHLENRYDTAGNKIQEEHTIFSATQSPRTVKNSWRYGPMNRLEALIEADGACNKTTQYFYNSLGQIERTIKPSGTELFKEYDASGHLSDYRGPDFTYQYTYDRNHRLLQVTDQTGSITTLNYNALGLIAQETLANGLTMRYDYDGRGQCRQMRLPDDSVIKYSHHGGLLRSIDRLDKQGRRSYTHSYLAYDLSGRLTKSQLIGNAGILTHQYDPCGRIRKIIHSAHAEEIQEYDAVGNLLAYSTTDAWGPQSYTFNYDDLYQLTSEENWQKHQYEHDSLQNRVEHDNTQCTVDELNQLTQEGDCQYAYNADGCLIHRQTPTETENYSYDSLNRLTALETTTKKTDFIYDPMDRRLSKTEHDLYYGTKTTIRYLYNGQNEIGAVNEQDFIIELRVLGHGLGAEIGAAVAIELNGYAYIPIHDHRGNAITLLYTNYFGTCNAVENYRYGAFGEEKILQTTALNPWRFSSKRTENGLVFFGKRFYDPIMGRWLTPDPEGFHDGPNLYAYVHNNPLTHFDLYGLERLSFQDPSFLQNDYDHDVSENTLGSATGSFKGFSNAFADIFSMGESPLRFSTEAVSFDREFSSKSSFDQGQTIGYYPGYVAGATTALYLSGIGRAVSSAISGGSRLVSSAYSGIRGSSLFRASAAETIGQRIADRSVTTLTAETMSLTAQGTSKQLPMQMHHFATNKNRRWTSRMSEIVNQYGLNLNGNWNKARMPHLGRHPNAYHEFVFKNIKKAAGEAGTNRSLFLQRFDLHVKQPVLNNPELLRKSGWVGK